MILYSLRCEQAHQFDVWFRDSSAYDQQVADGIVVCPQCGSQKVEKAIMSPRLSKGSGQEAVTEAPETEAQQAPSEGEAVPANPASEGTQDLQQQPPSEAEVRQAFRKLRQYVEANSDYVGSSFAEEARRIHNEEAPERNIYGETTPEEAEELEEEGVPFARVPWVSREDA